MSLDVVDEWDDLSDDAEQVVGLSVGDGVVDLHGHVITLLHVVEALFVELEGVLSVHESHVNEGVHLVLLGELSVGSNEESTDKHGKNEGLHLLYIKYYYLAIV